jgi:hypothetical protein
MTSNRRRGALVAAIIAVLFAIAGLPAHAGAPAAPAGSSGSSGPAGSAALAKATGADRFGPRLARAVDACAPSARTQAGFVGCVGDLAAPDRADAHQVDIWNVFLDCVAQWYRALDESTPPEEDVNDCLEDHGVDVGP